MDTTNPPMGGSQSSIFEEHHSFEMFYPVVRDPEDMEPSYGRFLFSATDEGNRFDTGPLVQQNEVIDHAGRMGDEENVFHFTTQARLGASEAWLATQPQPNDDDTEPDVQRLVRDMNSLKICSGGTWLHVESQVRIGGDPKDIDNLMLCIHRRTVLIDDQNRQVWDRALYKVTLPQFGALRLSDQWYRFLAHLLGRLSNRAARHFRFQLGQQGFDEVTSKWKSRDTIQANDIILQQVCQPLSLETFRRITQDESFDQLSKADQQAAHICVVCKEDSDFDQTAPVQLKCKHCLCAACLKTWLSNAGITKAGCPCCRAQLYPGELDQRYKLGVDVNGVYQWDDRFDKWENAERSLADLDLALAENNHDDLLTVNSQFVWDAWCHVVSQAAREPETSTPSCLNQTSWPEHGIIHNALEKALPELDGRQMAPSHLYSCMQRICNEGMLTAFQKSPLMELLPEHVSIERLQSDMRTNLESWLRLRPGWKEFVARSINRTINFVRICICECSTEGLHSHGPCRQYVNPLFTEEYPDGK